MSVVLVERVFPEPITEDEALALEDRVAGCHEEYGVRFLRTYISRDRRRVACVYEAPDAESVRFVQEKARLPYERLWPAIAIRYEGADARGDVVVLERALEPPLDEATLRDKSAQVAWCFDQWGCRIVRSFLSLDGRRCVCIFTAPDAESVRQSQHQAGLPYTRSWPATVREPSAPTAR